MYDLLSVYDCPNCGKKLSDEIEYLPVQVSEDDWEKIPFCNTCNREVKIRMHIDPETKQEVYHYEKVDIERARRAHGFYDEHRDESEYFSY